MSDGQNAPRSRASVPRGKALWLSALLLLIALSPLLPKEVRQLLLFGLAVGWIWKACRWSARRFGRRGIMANVAIAVSVLALVASAAWVNEPDRRTVAQIRQIPGCYPSTDGRLFTGKVDHVYINTTATDEDVSRFTEVDGLDHVRILIIDRVELSDATIGKFDRLRSLRYLTLTGTGAGNAAVVALSRKLPDCRIEVR